MSFLDLTDVKESSNLLTPGEYKVSCVDAVLKDTKAGNGQYISAQFKTESGFVLFHMFNTKNANQKAADIGLGQLKTFIRVAGGNLKLTSPQELCGLQCIVKVKTKADDYGEKSVITTFKPLDKSEKDDLPTF